MRVDRRTGSSSTTRIKPVRVCICSRSSFGRRGRPICSSTRSTRPTSSWKTSASRPLARRHRSRSSADRSRSGRPTAGRTNIFSGASSSNLVTYEVSAGGRLLVRDVWYKSGLSGGFANVHERAVFTAQNLRVANSIGAIPAFNITNLDGTATLLTAHITDRIAISGDGRNARFLGLGLFCEQPFSACFANSSSPTARAAGDQFPPEDDGDRQ